MKVSPFFRDIKRKVVAILCGKLSTKAPSNTGFSAHGFRLKYSSNLTLSMIRSWLSSVNATKCKIHMCTCYPFSVECQVFPSIVSFVIPFMA